MKVYCGLFPKTILLVLLLINVNVAKSLTNSFAEQSGIIDPYYPFHPQKVLEFTSSNLPIVIIDLDERMKDKELDTRITADMKIIWNTNGARNYYSYEGNFQNMELESK